FKKAAKQFNVDWRLLAAIGYQESHWDPTAVSPTGVRGLMMLTKVTAHSLGIYNRTDPKKSIFGGAEYIAYMHSRIPEDIPEPDRTWMALAAYNVGISHLEDARVITEIRGGDPDRWVDVRENLPLLSQKKWYSRTSHGYARGMEPVIYVENIRSYYDILVWTTSQSEPEPATPLPSGLTET
ncbi:MAG TPA: transglycosylase SLT domain-containing protein, partial [Gammaproteobacteria bacterium]|nr:transglycosylase SLT domain-containing protein [Gammaproteobacteria bacterium]